jgi:hypothetical protein
VCDVYVQIIPAMKSAGVDTAAVAAAAKLVEAGLAKVHHESDPAKKASLARTLRLETMMSVRSLPAYRPIFAYEAVLLPSR